MNIEKLDPRPARPHQPGSITTSWGRRSREVQVVMALEYLREENERQRFDILAMNHADLLREENERLKADAGLIEWQPIETAPKRN